MDYSLSSHMTWKKLLRAALPCILMMIATSIYSVVDGFFVSNYVGKTQFAAVNLIYPYIMVLSSLGFMMGTGGAALVSKRLGEGKKEEADELFGNCVLVTSLLSMLLSIVSLFFLPSIAKWLGADEEMLPYCISYGQILIVSITPFALQNLFQSFFTAGERPRLGFLITVGAGIVNILLDWILIVYAKLGILGAAIGTISGQCFGAILPLIYFLRGNDSPLKLRLGKLHFKGIAKMASNGLSEFANNISASAVSILLNMQLMKYYGENGVGAYGIICYVWLIFAACFIGFNVAVSPRISYALGAKNYAELRSLFVKSLVILTLFGVAQCSLSLALSYPIAMAFGGYDEALMNLTVHASLIYSLVYLFLGINMFGSAFFTALNNGVVSLLLSLIRLGALECVSVMVFPLFLSQEGIWWAIPFAEGVGFIMNFVVMFAFAKKYGYAKPKAEESPLS